jgi:hypothetical protein
MLGQPSRTSLGVNGVRVCVTRQAVPSMGRQLIRRTPAGHGIAGRLAGPATARERNDLCEPTVVESVARVLIRSRLLHGSQLTAAPVVSRCRLPVSERPPKQHSEAKPRKQHKRDGSKIKKGKHSELVPSSVTDVPTGPPAGGLPSTKAKVSDERRASKGVQVVRGTISIGGRR